MATAHPVQISIGATLAASLGSAVRSAQAQLNQLGSTMAELGNKQSGIRQLETLRSQAKDAALAMRAAQQRVSGLEANITGQNGGATARLGAVSRQLDSIGFAIYNRHILTCKGSSMSIGTVFVNNRTQAVRLPLDVRLPEGVHKVEIRVKGHERIIAPLGQSWDSFFLDGPRVSDDFLPERASQDQPEREAL